MAEIVSSTIVQETFSQILSDLFKKYYESKEKSNRNQDLERLEMAHIKLVAALEISGKWWITDASMLHWHMKLKRAAQECYETLQECKRRIIDEEQIEMEVRRSSFSKRVAHTTKSLALSIFNCKHNDLIQPVIRRFERFADGASEFLRFLELGGTPRHVRLFNPLIRHLLTGQMLQHKIIQENSECPLFLLWVPFITAGYGIEAGLIFVQKDENVLENDFFLSLMLQISESTDIVGIAIKCLQLFAPLFGSKVETISKELVQLPTRDLPWVSNVDSAQKEHWDNLHSFSTQWFRPNPLCCKQQDRQSLCHDNNMVHMSELSDTSLEPVIEVKLQCQVSQTEYNYNPQRTSLSEGRSSHQDSPQLKVGLLFMPHGSSEGLLPVHAVSSATQVINGEEKNCLHSNITLEQLEEILLPKAVDYFYQNEDASIYQILWKSKHGTTCVQIMNECARKTTRRDRKRKLLQREVQGLGDRTYVNVIPHFMKSWFVQAPITLQGSIADWIQKEEEMKLASLHYV